MGWTYRKSIALGRGLRLNISKRGLGLSAGPRGARVSVGPSGTRTSVGLPGSGLSYRSNWTRSPFRHLFWFLGLLFAAATYLAPYLL